MFSSEDTQPYAPPRASDQRCYGLYRGFVAGAADADHRVRLFVPEIYGAGVKSPLATPCLPQGVVPVFTIGTSVWVLFEGGDVARPVWIGSWHEQPLDTGWIAPTLNSGFTNYGGDYATAGYRKINGIVWLKGLVSPSTASVGAVAWTLLEGFRPAERRGWSVSAHDGTNYRIGRFDVLGNGQVQRIEPAVSTGTIFLDGISFPADA